MPELLIDFQLIMQLDPGDAANYGLRAQVQARRAWRAWQTGEADEARTAMAAALQQYEAALTLRPGLVAGLVGRGVARACLARWLGVTGADVTELLDGSESDFDQVLEIDPSSRRRSSDRALLRRYRAQLAQIALRGEQARRSLELARADAEAARVAAGADHPWRERIGELAQELR